MIALSLDKLISCVQLGFLGNVALGGSGSTMLGPITLRSDLIVVANWVGIGATAV